jgi:uncharacterized BrkB/YihY/UPF0761 family membrane protein
VTLWLLASAAFSVFIAHLSGFNVTYGSFAAAIILLPDSCSLMTMGN